MKQVATKTLIVGAVAFAAAAAAALYMTQQPTARTTSFSDPGDAAALVGEGNAEGGDGDDGSSTGGGRSEDGGSTGGGSSGDGGSTGGG